MSYDEVLAARIRTTLANEDVRLDERTMFGARVFMVEGHMCVGVIRDDLFVRVGRDAYPEMVTREHARTMDFNGRASDQMVYVAPEGVTTDDRLAAWVGHGLMHVRSLPPR